MRPVLVFGAASWATFLVACALSVYAFGQFGQVSGRSAALQLEAWLSLLGALVAAGAFGIASALLGRAHTQRAAFVLGVGGSVLLVASCWALTANQVAGTAYIAFALLIAVPSVAAYTGQAVGS